MAAIVVLGGAGAMGRITVMDLSSYFESEVVVSDLDQNRLDNLVDSLVPKQVVGKQVDLKDHDALVQLLSGAACVINSAPYYFNIDVMKAALDACTSYVDLGGLYHVTLEQLKLDRQFKDRGLTAILGCGASPGTTNVMVRFACQMLDTVSDIDIICAGVDLNPSKHPFEPPYMLDTLLDEYTKDAMVFENGAISTCAPFTREYSVEFPEPVGRQSAMPTLHSELATIPISFKDKGVSNVAFKLALPEEFHARLKFLVELGFGSPEPITTAEGTFSPRKILAKMIAAIESEEKAPDDCEILRVDVTGTEPGASDRTRVRVEATASTDSSLGIGGGDLNTGVPPSVIGQMIANGTIERKGVMAPESCIEPELFFKELARRKIRVTHEKTAQKEVARL